MSLKKLLLALLLAFPLAAGAATVTPEVATADTGATPNDSGAFTPVASDLLIVKVMASDTAQATATLTSSVGGFTFTQVRQCGFSGSQNSLYVFVSDALVSSATSQTVQFDTASDAATGTVIFVDAVAGITKDGLDAILQISECDVGAGGGTADPIFPAAVLTGNPTIGVAGNSTNPSGLVEPTGWTESSDTGYATPTSGGQAIYRNSGFTGTQVTWGSTYGTAGGAVLVEIDASAAPTFTVGPAEAPAADGFTISGTITGGGTLTVEAVWCNPGDAAPSNAELEAGQCGGGNGALANASEVWTTGVSNDFPLTSSNKPVRADVYVAGTDGTADTSVTTLADQDRTIKTGFLSVVMAAHSTTGVCNLDSYFNPDCADGDVFEYEDDTNENADCNVSFEADGDFILSPVAAGNCTGKRTFNISYEDVSSATTGLFTAPTVGNFTTDDLVCVNNTVPVDDAEVADAIVLLIEDTAMVERELASLFLDGDGDALTIAVTAGVVPTGTSVAADGSWTGTPTTENEAGVTLTVSATDECGDSDTYQFIVHVVTTFTVPDVVGLTVSAAEDAVVTAAPWRTNDPNVDVIGQTCSALTAGTILTQSPASAAQAGPSVPIDVTVAMDCGAVTWVSYARVWMFREVHKVYLTTASFKSAVELELRNDALWARWAPGTLPWSGSSNMQIDVSSIPGVAPLTSGGQLIP